MSLQLWSASSSQCERLVVKDVLVKGKFVLLCYHGSAGAWQGLREAAAVEAQLHSLKVWVTGAVLHYDMWSLMFSVCRGNWVPERSMKSVALCKMFVNLNSLQGLKWNWVLFVQLAQTLTHPKNRLSDCLFSFKKCCFQHWAKRLGKAMFPLQVLLLGEEQVNNSAAHSVMWKKDKGQGWTPDSAGGDSEWSSRLCPQSLSIISMCLRRTAGAGIGEDIFFHRRRLCDGW